MTIQLDQINGEINRRVREIKQLTENYLTLNEKFNSAKELETKITSNLTIIESLTTQVDEAHRKLTKSEDDLMQCQEKMSIMSAELFQASQERDHFTRLITQKGDELAQANKEIAQYATQIRKIQETE